MLKTAADAKAKLETEGLHVAFNSPDSLWIAASVREAGDGITLSDDACSLIWKPSGWVAVFPGEGLLSYEVPGILPELVPLITAVYTHYRRAGGPFQAAFPKVVSQPERYLLGDTPARV